MLSRLSIDTHTLNHKRMTKQNRKKKEKLMKGKRAAVCRAMEFVCQLLVKLPSNGHQSWRTSAWPKCACVSSFEFKLGLIVFAFNVFLPSFLCVCRLSFEAYVCAIGLIVLIDPLWIISFSQRKHNMNGGCPFSQWNETNWLETDLSKVLRFEKKHSIADGFFEQLFFSFR